MLLRKPPGEGLVAGSAPISGWEAKKELELGAVGEVADEKNEGIP
jgi:hypothetical protein